MKILEDFDYSEWCTGEDRLSLLLFIEEAYVLVHVENVLVCKTFDILGKGDTFLKILVLPVVVDRVVYNDAVDIVVRIGGYDGLFDLILSNSRQGILEAA